jgi:hypothetical protein
MSLALKIPKITDECLTENFTGKEERGEEKLDATRSLRTPVSSESSAHLKQRLSTHRRHLPIAF